MKVLLDQGIPRSAADLLRQSGIDAVHTGEIGLARAEDLTILGRARQDDRTVVTFDADFHLHMAVLSLQKPSTIRIRLEGLSEHGVADLVAAVLR